MFSETHVLLLRALQRSLHDRRLWSAQPFRTAMLAVGSGPNRSTRAPWRTEVVSLGILAAMLNFHSVHSGCLVMPPRGHTPAPMSWRRSRDVEPIQHSHSMLRLARKPLIRCVYLDETGSSSESMTMPYPNNPTGPLTTNTNNPGSIATGMYSRLPRFATLQHLVRHETHWNNTYPSHLTRLYTLDLHLAMVFRGVLGLRTFGDQAVSQRG